MKLHKERQTYEDTNYYYFVDEPVYKKYKTKKVPTFCDDCGHKTGFEVIKVGIGLLGYEKTKYKKDPMYALNNMLYSKIVDDLSQPNTIFNKIK